MKIAARRAGFAVVCVVCSVFSQAQSHGKLQFDLAQIGLLVNGQQVCEDAGRIQDSQSTVVNQIIAAGPKAIPVLIDMLTDTRTANTKEPIICHWGAMTIGDIAFCALTDLFIDPTAGVTVPGAGWDDMLGPTGDVPAWQQLDAYVKKNGRATLQDKWRKVWARYGSQMYWDAEGRCFKLRRA
jgi:hypothetical protein